MSQAEQTPSGSLLLKYECYLPERSQSQPTEDEAYCILALKIAILRSETELAAGRAMCNLTHSLHPPPDTTVRPLADHRLVLPGPKRLHLSAALRATRSVTRTSVYASVARISGASANPALRSPTSCPVRFVPLRLLDVFPQSPNVTSERDDHHGFLQIVLGNDTSRLNINTTARSG